MAQMKIAELETQLQATIDELTTAQSNEKEIRSRITERENASNHNLLPFESKNG
ncbi:MAG: hypothetical protein KME10_11680 [Plectolyngbya sp. WJT66-NPBG17]|nr:hypothetical protein [Plectolyngbya sp. WJT66-NPBG17]